MSYLAFIYKAYNGFKANITFFRKEKHSATPWLRLTVLPGIGSKNAKTFFDAGFTTPKKLLKASDNQLLQIPGVGKSFLKRLRSYSL